MDQENKNTRQNYVLRTIKKYETTSNVLVCSTRTETSAQQPIFDAR